MWKPKQHLHGRVIDALYMGGFTTIQIEMLGWLSYTAAALNNSRNPVAAAHTILANFSNEDHKLHRMLLTFERRKRESIKPTKKADHTVADNVLGALDADIKDAIQVAALRAGDYEDLTKGGISDGKDSITSSPDRDGFEPILGEDLSEGADIDEAELAEGAAND